MVLEYIMFTWFDYYYFQVSFTHGMSVPGHEFWTAAKTPFNRLSSGIFLEVSINGFGRSLDSAANAKPLKESEHIKGALALFSAVVMGLATGN